MRDLVCLGLGLAVYLGVAYDDLHDDMFAYGLLWGPASSDRHFNFVGVRLCAMS